MAHDLKVAVIVEDKASAQLGKIEKSTKKSEKAMNSGSVSTSKFDRLLGHLGMTSDGASKRLNKLGSAVGGVVSTVAKSAAVGLTAAAAGVTAFTVSATRDFMTFEREMNTVFTLLPDFTEAQMDKMRKDVLRFSGDMAAMPANVVPALASAIGSGIEDHEVFEFLEVAQKAAVGGSAELLTAVDGLTSVVNAYGSDVITAQRAADLMFRTADLGKTDIDALSRTLYNVTPTASSLGVAFEDVSAAIALMTAQGTPTSVATTQMRQLFVELSKSSSQAAKIFEGLAGKSFRKFIDEGGNTQDALKVLEAGASKAGLGINDLFGSVEAGAAALQLTGKNEEKFTEFIDAMAASAGATDAAYDRLAQGLGYSLDRIRSKFSVFKLQVGEVAANFALGFMPGIEGAFDRFTDYVNSRFINNPEFQKITSLSGKFEFVIQEFSDTFKRWYDGGGKQQITEAVDTTIRFMSQMMEPLKQPLIDAGVKLGKALGQGLLDGLNAFAEENPMLAAGLTYLATPGNPATKMAAASAVLVSANTNKALKTVEKNRQVAEGSRRELWERSQNLPEGVPLIENTALEPMPQRSWWDRRKSDARLFMIDKGWMSPPEPKIDGSYATGLSYVPYDGYVARLHKGEGILRADENREYQRGGTGGGDVNITINYTSTAGGTEQDADILMGLIARKMNEIGGVMANVQTD